MSHIKTFARLKPAHDLYNEYDISDKKTFKLRVPELLRDYGLLASKNRLSTISYDFQFDRVFNTEGTQEEVYALAAKEIVTGFLDGYNGTIFAYGQTGTGKTFTVEGSALRYSDRGLAPRALADIYKSLEKREDEEISLHISYLEIYQEVAYDLLSTTARTASPVTVFPKVNVVEGANGTCAIRNLSLHLAPSEDVAHALLLQGQANRKVAETPVNQRSSRSHAVFTIYLTAKKQQSDIITRSKLHLVDLAGSERVAKTGVDGQQLTEAKSINLSLHYLETVIIALQADSAQHRPQSTKSGNKSNSSFGGRPNSADGVRRHVPYRNSLLTMVLRDSLGGNCQTSMIATISLEVHNLGETLSTCRFAQRVACISNHARRNEEIDDKTLIQQLKRRIAELEVQMACLRLSQGGEGEEREDDDTSSKLTDEDKLACAQVIQEYLAGRIADPVTAGITNPFKFRECLRILKRMIMNKYFQHKLVQNGQGLATGSPPSLAPAGLPSSHSTHTSGTANTERGTVEVKGNTQILRLDNASPALESQGVLSSQPVTNGDMDADEMILNIQRLYAASRRDQRSRQQGAENPVTPPRTAVVRSEAYKSPFERKREKEIRRLSRKVDTMKKSQMTQEEHLQALRTSTAYGEMSNMESIIRNKIQVTRDQIADQHAYRLHLRHTEANPEILQQEKMVEDQLIKREAKFQKKLDEVLQKKKEFDSQLAQDEAGETRNGASEVQGQVKATEKRSLEEQFSQYKKRNGTLNTRQVFDLLKSEEKKQTKASHQVEVEKKFLKTKQLALREEATREKLRELKEMLRKSREESFLGYATDTDMARGNAFAPSFLLQTSFTVDENGERNDMQVTDLEGPRQEQVFAGGQPEAEKSRLAPPCSDDLETSMTRGEDGDKSVVGKPASQRQGGVVAHRPETLGHPSSSQAKTPSRSSSKADLKWESAYSRPPTAHSIRSADNPPLQQGQDGGSGAPGQPFGVGSYQNSRHPDNVEPVTERSSSRVSANSNSSVALSEAKSSASDSRLDSGKGEEQKQVTLSLEEQNNDGRGDQRSPAPDAPPESYSPTVMPSEYVHNMDSRDKFDARKMGLSSKTFESALSSMLNDDASAKPVSYGFQFYDQYARESGPRTRSTARKAVTSSRISERHVTTTSPSRTPERRRTTTTNTTSDLPPDHSGKFANAWGPEAKNFSVAKRLAQFLGEDKDSKPPIPKSDPPTSAVLGRGLGFLERLNQLQGEGFPEPAPVSPRIQAMEEQQREPSYMSRVQAERQRVSRIREARRAAEAIQQAWRRYRRRRGARQ